MREQTEGGLRKEAPPRLVHSLRGSSGDPSWMMVLTCVVKSGKRERSWNQCHCSNKREIH